MVAARSMVGTPFHWHGRLPGVGIDCSGLIIKAAEEAGVSFSFMGKYSRADQASAIDAALKEHCVRLDRRHKPKPGDIFFIDVPAGPGHLMIFTGDGVIHASDKPCFMAVVEQPFDVTSELDSISAIYRLKEST